MIIKFIKKQFDKIFYKKLQRDLRSIDYNELKHWALSKKWEALREQDNEKYESFEWYEEILCILEKAFGK